MTDPSVLTVGMAQIAPVWLDKTRTLEKVMDYVQKAADQGVEMVVFGESLLPGYPFWLSITNGSAFNDQVQKEIHAHYLREAVSIEAGDLDALCQLAAQRSIAVYLGTIERPLDRGAHSCYCSLVYIDPKGQIQSVHRKLQPTYEERLCWSPGDGHGLQVHSLKGAFRVGGLNCWENWMPLSRTALYAQGMNVHVAAWPGGDHNTHDLTRFIAKESRSYVLSVCGLMSKAMIPAEVPHADKMIANAPAWMANGGSAIAAPDGEWVIEPILHEEGLFTAELALQKIYEERQNFDPTGHYSRPSITRLEVNRERQKLVDFRD
ncbi:MAG: carbon-nitrogen hydrolase family protein [Bacteroidota bacterium]